MDVRLTAVLCLQIAVIEARGAGRLALRHARVRNDTAVEAVIVGADHAAARAVGVGPERSLAAAIDDVMIAIGKPIGTRPAAVAVTATRPGVGASRSRIVGEAATPEGEHQPN